MWHLNEDLFELDLAEEIAVYTPTSLRAMIAEPQKLDSLMRVIRSINPCIMVVTELEADHNWAVFVTRFIEALFYYSAYFDCLEAYLNHDDENRIITESVYFGD